MKDHDHQPIIPENPVPAVADLPGERTPGEYAERCADVDLAMACARSRVEEWDRARDPDGWWHERSDWIALHNEILRLRASTGNLAVWLHEQIATRQTEIDTAINLNHQMGHYAGTYTAINIYQQMLAMVEAQP